MVENSKYSCNILPAEQADAARYLFDYQMVNFEHIEDLIF
jgi:hypothetical protein